MKKIYTLIAGLLLAGSASAQLVNGNFEATMTAVNASALPGVYTTAGWGIGLYSPQTTSPGEGAQSAILTTVNNPTLAAAIQSPSDTIGGQISQSVNGTVTNPGALTVSLKYKYAPVNSDTGVFVVEIYDTMTADDGSDDKLLYQGVSIFTGTVATWTARTVTLTQNPSETGTPNQVFMIGGSSIGGVFNGFVAPRPGSALQLDDVKMNTGNVGLEENALSASKIYPNPASDVLNFNLNGNDATAVNIYSLDGKLLITQDVNGATGSVNVSSLTTGLYIYQIATTTGETVKSTFVKK